MTNLTRTKQFLYIKITQPMNFSIILKLIFVVPFFVLMIIAKKTTLFSPISSKKTIVGDTLTEEQKRLPENAVKNLKITEGLQVQLFASEPMMTNPTNIDVDDKGRVWVCEAFNYRPDITGNTTHKEGDRILILEDSNGDGKADKSTVFYQGSEIESPLGIWVMGNQAIVSQSPYVWLFTDDNGDDKADRKEILLQGMGGKQHDHGMHAFTFGPDGKYYFNFGNEGQTLKDKNGNILKDKEGNDISLKNYKMGMVFRCNPDMSEIEVLGNNFRNNYEVAVDSYGTMWQSDNDDDGNKGVRINYVMDYGNYGYTDEMTGAGWQANRTNIEEEIPRRHWHLNDPGVVPNLLQTGAGSPTGMCIYEGDLLPEVFRGQMIHSDAGPNVVRSYPVTKDGAGYKAEIVNILEGVGDQWFRPSDVCVAPDGSLMVADWYDPGVGGHQAGDLNRGRVFRVAPPSTIYKSPTFNYQNTEGAIAALQNPNLSVRWKAWTALHKMGETAESALLKLYNEATNPRMKARAFWLLAKGKNGEKYIEMASKDANSDIKMAAIRAARQSKMDIIPLLKKLVSDKDAQVRRECLLALRHNPSPEAVNLLTILALQYDGKDRWYLEALGIGADKKWDAVLGNLLVTTSNIKPSKEAINDIMWRSRGEMTATALSQLASDKTIPLKDRLRYFRAFDFIPSSNKSQVLLDIIKKTATSEPEISPIALRHLDANLVKTNPEAKKILRSTMANLKGKEYIEFADRYVLIEEQPRLLDMILKNENARDASNVLTKNTVQGTPNGEGVAFLKGIINNPKKEEEALKIMTAMRGLGGKTQLDILNAAAFDKKRSEKFRRNAFENLGGSWDGENMILEYLKEGKIDKPFIPSAVQGVSKAWRLNVRKEAYKYLGNAATTQAKMPNINELVGMKGDAAKGLEQFKTYCGICHQVKNEGTDFGPKLTSIGAKLPKEGQYLAILHPDAGISFGYEGWEIKMKDGSTYMGIISSRTESEWTMKLAGGASQNLKVNDIKSKKQLPNSLMPTGFHESLNKQELADLVEYLMTLK
jgi:putative membrane-bound dehydrogenase-like protein